MSLITQFSFLQSWDKPHVLLNTALQEVTISPSEMTSCVTFYMVFVEILQQEVVAQNADGPVYHSRFRIINLHLILDFQILTFKAI